MRHSIGLAAWILVALAGPAVTVMGADARDGSSTRPKDDLSVLSDEFIDPRTLAQWHRVEQVEKSGASQLRRAAIDVKAGVLTLEPHASVWYRDYRGVLLFKPVSGDFIATTRLHVTGRAGDSAPRSQFSLAGIMVRTPRNVTPQTWRPGGENYVFLSLGAADQPGRYQLEVKTTLNSDSQLQISDGAEEADLRCARIGSAFILLRRFANGPWQVHQRYHRPDMPRTLQVGLTCYTDWPTCERLIPEVHNRTVIQSGNPDLLARIDYFRFRRPVMPSELRGRNLADPRQVSDATLLGFLGNAAD